MIELEHSPLGGSGAHRWFECAGSFLLHRALLEAEEFENVESEYAKLGTAAHELGARCLTEQREPFEFVGQKIGGYVVGAVDGIDPDAVAVYVTDCARLASRVDNCTTLVEATISRPDIHPHLRGTVDFGMISPLKLALRDYKNGEGVGVRAVGNKQLLYYGFLLARNIPDVATWDRTTPVDLGIVQPNFYGVFEAPETWETTLGEILDFGHDALIPRMHELTQTQDVDESDFVPGSHCQFCPVLLECPAMQKAFKTYVEGTEFIEMLSNEELDGFYNQREHAKRFMTALEQTVHARLITGGEIPSAKLVEKQTKRVWKMGAEPALKLAFGEHAFEPAKIKSPAQIEKLSSRGKEMALEYGYKPEANGLTVAPLSDPRPAAKPPSNATTFANFQQTPEEAGF